MFVCFFNKTRKPIDAEHTTIVTEKHDGGKQSLEEMFCIHVCNSNKAFLNIVAVGGRGGERHPRGEPGPTPQPTRPVTSGSKVGKMRRFLFYLN